MFNQRFKTVSVKEVSMDDLAKYTEAQYAAPLDGTLVKSSDSDTVYYISKGLRLPVTFRVFTLRKLNFSDVNKLSNEEVNSWLIGSFLTPPEGTLLRTSTNPVVYWVVEGVLHPVNAGFYKDRALNIFPVIIASDDEIKGFSKGDPYIK